VEAAEPEADADLGANISFHELAHYLTFLQEPARRKKAQITKSLSVWLGGRDSNPDIQIQSLFKAPADQSNQPLSSADCEQLRQNPQYCRNEQEVDFEEQTLP
jgi:hypothetical protein